MYAIFNSTKKETEFIVPDDPDLAEDAARFMNESFNGSYKYFEIPYFKSMEDIENGI